MKEEGGQNGPIKEAEERTNEGKRKRNKERRRGKEKNKFCYPRITTSRPRNKPIPCVISFIARKVQNRPNLTAAVSLVGVSVEMVESTFS